MTITVYPADAVAGAPSYTGRKLRQAMSALAAGATAGRPLGGLSGVRPGSGVVGSATSTTWTITAHAGQLDLQAAAEASVYQYAIDASVTGAVTAADASNPRVDIVYLTLNDPAEGDGSTAPAVVPGYLAGTAAATPVAPATPARSVVLFSIAVPKVGAGSPTVAMVAPEVGGAGAPVRVRSQSQRATLTPSVGDQVIRLDVGPDKQNTARKGRVETWDGVGWWTMVFGEETVNTNPTGDFSITTGLATLVTSTMENANGGVATGARQNITVAKNATYSGGTLTGRIYAAETHVALSSTTAGILWHAWGYS